MTNEDLFRVFAKSDFDKVTELLNKGYTETSEWKESLEMLASSLDSLLQDMDRGAA